MNASNKISLDVDDLVDRFKRVLQVSSDRELAKRLEFNSPSTIAGWRTNGRVDFPRIHQLFPGISFDYLVYGTGTPFVQPTETDELDMAIQLYSRLQSSKDPATQFLLKVEAFKPLLDKIQHSDITVEEKRSKTKDILKLWAQFLKEANAQFARSND